MRVYRAEKSGSLLLVRAFVEGARGKAYPKLLLDTGSAYTLVSQEILESIGCSPAQPERTQRIITGSGYEIVPVVLVKRLNCMGSLLENFEILAQLFLSVLTLMAYWVWTFCANLKLRSNSIQARY